MEAKRSPWPRIREKLGSLTLGLAPGIVFWVVATYFVYTHDPNPAGHATELLFGWLVPGKSPSGLLATLIIGAFKVVLGAWCWVSVIVTAPIGLAIALAPVSRAAAVILVGLCFGAVYLVLGRDGIVDVSRRTIQAIESLIGMTGQRREPMPATGVTMGSDTAERAAQRAEATLRSSLNTMHDSMVGMGVPMDAVPTSAKKWGGYIANVRQRFAFDQETKTARKMSEYLESVNKCYEEWTKHVRLRDEVADMERDRKIRATQRDTEEKAAENRLREVAEIERREQDLRIKELKLKDAKLDAETDALRNPKVVKQESAAERELRLAAEKVESLDVLRVWYEEAIKKSPHLKPDIDAIVDSRRIAILDGD